MIFGQISGQVELWSDVPPSMRLLVRLTVVQTLDQFQLWFRCSAKSRDLLVKYDTISSQVDIWSDIRSG